jgi:hypothetical protein
MSVTGSQSFYVPRNPSFFNNVIAGHQFVIPD